MFEGVKRLYYFTGPQHAVENIKNRQLKVSFPNEVNDIFEMMPFDFGNDRAARKAWREAISDFSQKVGFISFSTSWQVPTMWGHYARSHKGVCYGFDVQGEIGEMEYVPSFKPFDTKAPAQGKEQIEAFLYALQTKSTHWEYEKEWRMLVELSALEVRRKKEGQPLFFKQFGDNLVLKEIIIGAKSDKTSSDFHKVLAGHQTVSIKTARASFRGFEIVEQNNSKLQK
jgi:hypothetical protein